MPRDAQLEVLVELNVMQALLEPLQVAQVVHIFVQLPFFGVHVGRQALLSDVLAHRGRRVHVVHGRPLGAVLIAPWNCVPHTARGCLRKPSLTRCSPYVWVCRAFLRGGGLTHTLADPLTQSHCWGR